MRNKETKIYEIEIDAIKRELKKLPEGQMTKKGAFFYETIGTVQKGITRDYQKIMQLTRKAYLLRRLSHLECNYSLIKKQAGRYKTEVPADIIRKLPSFYQTLPVFYFFNPSVQDQIEEISVGNAIRTDGLIYLTNSGIIVRSKSERTIADALDQNRILYRYEAELTFGSSSTHPDFTIFRLSDGKMIIWEHFGLIDQEEYRHKTNTKLALYNRYGFYPFNNLICTYEQDLKDPAHIQEIIEMMLLR
jgi:hypothetical protein